MKDLIQVWGVFPFTLTAIVALTTARAIVKYLIEFIGHSLKRPRFFLCTHPPRTDGTYYVKDKIGIYQIAHYTPEHGFRSPEDFSEIDVFLWSYLPTTKEEYFPRRTFDQALAEVAEDETGRLAKNEKRCQ